MERYLIIRNLFRIHPFYYLTAFFCFFTGHFKEFCIFNIIIFVHEFGHLFMAFLFKWKIFRVIILPFGGLTIFNEDINKPIYQEFLILIFGPLFQIVFTYFFRNSGLLFNYSKDILFFNLIPIFPLDGYKFVNLFLNLFFSFKNSYFYSLIISFVFIIILFFDFSLINYLILFLLFFKLLSEFKNRYNVFNRFLLERYYKEFSFKKLCYIESLDCGKMRRDYRHFFYNGQRYITERENLKKRFDFNVKTW